MSSRSGKVALVTGASAGLGEVFAELFAADGHDVVLVARRLAKLELLAKRLKEAHGVNVHSVAADLSDSSSPEAIYQSVGDKGLTIDFLVNNAGLGTTGPFIELDLQRELGMLDVNIRALVHLTRLFVPGMVERGSGRVLNVGSTAGFQAGPYMASYYASKAFVVSFSEALWHELRGKGVTVTVSCPGATATEFAMVAGNDKSKLFKSGVASSDAVAGEAYRAMHKGRRLVIHGWKNRAMFHSLRITPRAVVQKITSGLNRP